MSPTEGWDGRRYPPKYEIPPPPCDGCIMHDACAEKEWACEEFLTYVAGDRRRKVGRRPCRRLYERVFQGDI